MHDTALVSVAASLLIEQDTTRLWLASWARMRIIVLLNVFVRHVDDQHRLPTTTHTLLAIHTAPQRTFVAHGIYN